MSQTVIEAGIIATIKLHADFSDDNVFLYDRRTALGKGLDRAVVVSYGQIGNAEATIKMILRTWTYNVDVLVPWRGELTEMDQRVGVETQKVIDTLDAYPRLNATAGVVDSILTTSNSPDVLSYKKGVYRGRRHILTIQEVVDPERAE